MRHGRVSIEMLLATLMVTGLHPADIARADQQQFETEVRPLLIDHCLKCHGPDKQEGGLRLDSADGLNRGGDSGAVVTPDRPTESLLWQRVAAGEMPPATEPRLTAREQQSLRKWIESGAEMPARALDLAEAKDWRRLWSFHSFKQNSSLTPTSANVTPKEAQQIGTGWNPVLRNLKAWYRASDLKLSEWGEVNRWPDRSGHGRDLLATRGAHLNGLGGPAYYMPASSIVRRPAVRFVESSGFGSPGDNPVEIQGNAGFSLVMVCRLQPRTGSYPHDLLLSVGEFSFPDNPGRPLAAALGIQRAPGADHRLAFVGGWGHDGHLAPGSFARLYFQTCVITLVKTPGAVAQTTNLFINGVPSSAVPALGKITGSEEIPDYQPRQSRDFSVMLGNAVGGAGGFAGDVAEVLVYSAPLTDEEHMQTETGLMQEYVEFLSGSSPQTTNEPHGSNRLTPDPGSLQADLRISELASLRWSDVDMDKGLITLTDETKKRFRQGKEKRTTKSGRDRTFPIHEMLREVLANMPHHADGKVFHGPLDGKIKADTVRQILIKAVLTPLSAQFPSKTDEPGFIDGRLHSFRHYFCSNCANQGVKERVLMNWLGHRNSRMVHRYYHLHDEESIRQMQQLKLY